MKGIGDRNTQGSVIKAHRVWPCDTAKIKILSLHRKSLGVMVLRIPLSVLCPRSGHRKT